MSTKGTIYNILMREFNNCASVRKENQTIWLYKKHYSPFRDLGESYFILDAYYIASNELYSQSSSVLRELKEIGITVKRYKGDDYKALLVRSGLSYGCRRNSLSYDESGSRFVIGAIVLEEKEEEYLKDVLDWDSQSALCGLCRECVNACPTGAISLTGLNPYACLRHFMDYGEFPDGSTAKSSGRRLLGCDICQRVCPFNKQEEVDVPADLLEVLSINGFCERLLSNRDTLSKRIGVNYTNIKKLSKISKQLIANTSA